MVDFRFDDDVEAFRTEVQVFLTTVMADARANMDPSDLTGLAEGFERALHRAAGQRGWLQLAPEYQAVFGFEVARADAPLVDTAITLAGYAIATFGSAPLKERLLPQMVSGEVEVCIAYTEPSAGSDLSAIEAMATPADDGWVLRGTKVLVTGAHKADWCCTVARTRHDVPIRQGMSMFIVEMGAPGVEVVRHPTMNGWTLDEIRFHDVRLGPDALLGERDGGWRQLVAAVSAERSGVFWLGFARHLLDLLIDYVRGAAPDDPIARDTVGRLTVEFAAADRLVRRTLWSMLKERDEPVLASMAKVVTTELLQDLAQAATELAGAAGLVWAPLFGARPPGAAAGGRFAYEYLERVHGTIGAGVNEVQRDAIAQFGLGLPRRR